MKKDNILEFVKAINDYDVDPIVTAEFYSDESGKEFCLLITPNTKYQEDDGSNMNIVIAVDF